MRNAPGNNATRCSLERSYQRPINMMIENGNRKIFIVSTRNVELGLKFEPAFNRRTFALMLPAYLASEVDLSPSSVTRMTRSGCVEICCIDPHSAELEDFIDSALEDSGCLNVATSSFLEENEGLEYFLFAAGGADHNVDLVAVIAEHADLQATLASMVT